jgi:peptidoglycan-associated lipoprotein
MQTGPSQVTSGAIAPALSCQKKDKDVLVVSGLIVSLAAVIGAVWYYSSNEQTVASDSLNGAQVSQALNTTQPVVAPVSMSPAKPADAALLPSTARVVHTDLYFEVGRKGLTDEARTLLEAQASILKQDASLGVLVQGYTDLQGSAAFNRKLGMKRAESVKSELINAGVSEHQIKTVSLGKDGALCIDSSDVCRHMNRRVHLEVRPIGEEHMRPPVVATTPAPEQTQASAEPAQSTEAGGSLIDGLAPSAEASQGESDPPALEPASGS